MASNYNNNSNDLWSWLAVIIALIVFWPVGLILLFRKLMGGAPSERRARHPADIQREHEAAGQVPGTQGVYQKQGSAAPQPRSRNQRRRTPPAMGRVNLDRGKGLTVTGAVFTGVFGFTAVAATLDALSWGGLRHELSGIFLLFGFCGAGLVMLYTGSQRTKKSKRFRRYLALIGRRADISIATLAQAMSVSIHTACEDLQEMLDTGILPTGYLDLGSGRLVLSDEGLIEEEPAPAAPEPEESEELDDNALLHAIRTVNDSIADPVMSRKIDRIGEITGKILTYQKQNPGKETQLRSFLSYYLPTTLKILKAYAQMEAQGIEGENIKAAKDRIEGMMDKVVEGFEKQLDKLFQDDAMDITTDVEVLERMLDKDGLSGGSGLQLGG